MTFWKVQRAKFRQFEGLLGSSPCKIGGSLKKAVTSFPKTVSLTIGLTVIRDYLGPCQKSKIELFGANR